jgi:hypothetical protein
MQMPDGGVLLALLLAGFQWQPHCEQPESFGEGMPLACVAMEQTPVETPYFRAVVPAGVRYGVCDDGHCLEVQGLSERPPTSFQVLYQPLKGRLLAVRTLEELATLLAAPMRPCQVTERQGVEWLHCGYDFAGHLAASRVNEGDYYRLLDGHWLGVRYTLSKGQDFQANQDRFERLMRSIEVISTDL